jgi:hypothetical protein
VLDIGEVLARHGYPAPAGAVLVKLTTGLYHALHEHPPAYLPTDYCPSGKRPQATPTKAKSTVQAQQHHDPLTPTTVTQRDKPKITCQQGEDQEPSTDTVVSADTAPSPRRCRGCAPARTPLTQGVQMQSAPV